MNEVESKIKKAVEDAKGDMDKPEVRACFDDLCKDQPPEVKSRIAHIALGVKKDYDKRNPVA